MLEKNIKSLLIFVTAKIQFNLMVTMVTIYCPVKI